MALKVLDLDYLRAQNTSQGQVIVAGSGTGVTYSPNVYIKNSKIGIGSSTPLNEVSVVGNIAVFGPGAGFVFADGSHQTTATTNTPPGGSSGTIQFNNNGSFSGNINLFYDQNLTRVGIGTSIPKSTLQIKDVG